MSAFTQEPKEITKVIVAGQFPPPVNGFAYITQEISKVFAKNYQTQIIDIAPHVKNNGLPYHMHRLWLTVKGCFSLLKQGSQENAVFYTACESRLGLVYTILLSLTARLLKLPTYIHYHNYNFIDKRSLFISFLLMVLGADAIHIFLCEGMAAKFANRYKRTLKYAVLSNSAFVSSIHDAPKKWEQDTPLILGLLSNLDESKGLSLFIETLKQAVSKGLNVKGILAGPPVTDADKETIKRAEKELCDILEYRGPLYGADKDAFFCEIDIFVFPTCYMNEAQPAVIFEAMAHGAPVLSYDRGSIKGQVGSCGVVQERGGEFAAFAVNWLSEQMKTPDALNKLKLETKASFVKDKEKATRNRSVLYLSR